MPLPIRTRTHLVDTAFPDLGGEHRGKSDQPEAAGFSANVDPARFSRSSILRHESENLIYNIAGERMMPREVFKERNGLRFVIPQS
jgi:hypothetical protein